jgi:flagellar basal body-associated protein FliL
VRCSYDNETDRKDNVSLLWIILIVVLVLVLLGFLGRGRY